MNLHWFLRMSKWVRNPPSAGRVKLVFAVVAICVLIVGLEAMGWWPEWATTEKFKLRPSIRP
jgi:hypothetical protein